VRKYRGGWVHWRQFSAALGGVDGPPRCRAPSRGLAAGIFTSVSAAGHVTGHFLALVTYLLGYDASLAFCLLTFWPVFDGQASV